MEDNDYPRRIRIIESHVAACETKWQGCHEKHRVLEDDLTGLEKTIKETQSQMQRLMGGMAVAIPLLSFMTPPDG